MKTRFAWLSAAVAVAAVVSVAAVADALADFPKQGVTGNLKLSKSVPLPKPAKLVVVSRDSGRPAANLILTESNEVLVGDASGKFHEVFRPSKASNKIFAMPDTLGRSLGITEQGPGGAFYLFDAMGKPLAKIPKLSDYRYVQSEPTRPLILSHPTGGWPGWPSIWNTDGSRHEGMQKGWPADESVSVIRFAPDATKIGVLSVREPSTSNFTLRVYSSMGKLLWKEVVQQDSATADFMFSRRTGRLIGLATASELRIITSEGKLLGTVPAPTRSTILLDFSRDEKHVVLASANELFSIGVADRKVSWSWDAQSLQTSNSLSSGTVHITRAISSADGQTVAVSGFVSVRSPWSRPDGIQTYRVDLADEFIAVIRGGNVVDAVRLTPNTLLKDISQSRTGQANSFCLSDDGSRLTIPTRQAILEYVLSR